MHDIDRTYMGTGWESGTFEGEYEYEDAYEGEYEGEGEMDGVYEIYGETQEGMYGEMYNETYDEAAMTHGLFSEMDEMEIAADLLEVTNEAELNQFLGDLLRKAGQTAGGALSGSEGNALGGVLKGIARKALPKAGAALGKVASGANGAIGKQLASSAGHLFGLEMEGMSAEDQEFEVARRFVHLAGDAVQNVLQASPKIPVGDAVQKAVATAAQHHAPGLLKLAAAARPSSARDGQQRRRPQRSAEGEASSMDRFAANPFSEAEEMELAAELLEITDEAEMDQFLGNLFKKAAGALKGVAKKALPIVGGALGSLIPIPGVGTAVGSALGGAVSKALEMEFAGLHDEDQAFEKARRFVRVAGSAAQEIAEAQPDANPQAVAHKAVITAARQHVPGLAKNDGSASNSSTGQRQKGSNRGPNDRPNDKPNARASSGSQSGRWERRGNTIILHGI